MYPGFVAETYKEMTWSVMRSPLLPPTPEGCGKPCSHSPFRRCVIKNLDPNIINAPLSQSLVDQFTNQSLGLVTERTDDPH